MSGQKIDKVGAAVEAVEKAAKEEALKEKNQRLKDQYNKDFQKYQEGKMLEEQAFMKHVEDYRQKYGKRNDKGEIVGGPWDTSDDEAKRALNSETTAYNSEWKNAMLSLLGSFAKMCEAMHYTLSTDERIHAVTSGAKNWVLDKIYTPKQPKDLTELGKAIIPTLMHDVTINDTGRLQVKISAGNKVMDDKFTELFSGLVEHWLEQEGYTRGQSPATKDQYFAQDGTQLTQAKLKSLQEDDTHSLQSFLEERSSHSYQAAPTP